MGLVLTEGPPVAGDDATELLVHRFPGRSRSMVWGSIVVPPGTSPSQAYNIQGSACQVWRINDRVRGVAAVVNGNAQSWIGNSGVLRVGSGAGTVPAEAGAFPTIDLSGMELELEIDGSIFKATLADALLQDKVAPIGPGLREHSGPDLIRRKHYLLRLQLDGSDGSDEEEHFCTIADVHVTTRVDMDLASVVIHWQNAAWRAANNPFRENEVCDGRVYFDSLKIARSTLPANYDVQFDIEHEFRTVTPTHVELVSEMSGADEVHLLPPASQTVCRFAVYNPATVTAEDARLAQAHHDRFLAHGPLSFYWTRAFGEKRDILCSPALAEWRDPNPNTPADPWRAHDALYVQYLARIRTNFVNGQGGSGALSFEPRYGWFYGLYDYTVGGTGGVGVSGVSFPAHGRGGFEWATLALEALANRCPHAQVDIDSGRCVNDTLLAENNSSSWVDRYGGSPGQVGFLPFQTTNGLRRNTWMIPHFVLPGSDLGGSGWGSSPGEDQFTLAPTGRSWNDPPSGKSCPYEANIDPQERYAPFDLAHSSRAQAPIRDAAFLLDDPVAHRLSEQWGASRAMLNNSALEVRGHIIRGDAYKDANFARILSANQAPERFGYWKIPESIYPGGPADNARTYWWSLCHAVLWWELAPTEERTRMKRWFEVVSDVFERTITDIGNPSRHSSPHPNPDPFDTNVYGPTDIPNRTGAYPNNEGTRKPSGAFSFQDSFAIGAFAALKQGPLANDPQRRNAHDRVIRFGSNWLAHARTNFPTGNYVAPTTHTMISDGPNGVFDPPFTPQQYRSTRWTLRRDGGQGDIHTIHNFPGQAAVYGFRDTGDMAHFDILAGILSVPAGDENSLFTVARQVWQERFQSPNFRQNSGLFGEHLWWLSGLAELTLRRHGIEPV